MCGLIECSIIQFDLSVNFLWQKLTDWPLKLQSVKLKWKNNKLFFGKYSHV